MQPLVQSLSCHTVSRSQRPPSQRPEESITIGDHCCGADARDGYPRVLSASRRRVQRQLRQPCSLACPASALAVHACIATSTFGYLQAHANAMQAQQPWVNETFVQDTRGRRKTPAGRCVVTAVHFSRANVDMCSCMRRACSVQRRKCTRSGIPYVPGHKKTHADHGIVYKSPVRGLQVYTRRLLWFDRALATAVTVSASDGLLYEGMTSFLSPRLPVCFISV